MIYMPTTATISPTHSSYTAHNRHITVNTVESSPTFEVVHPALSVRVFHFDRLIRRLVALDLVRAFLRADEAVLTAQHQQRSVDDGEVELLLRRDLRADGVQTAVGTGRHVAVVARLQGQSSVVQPLDVEQTVG